MTDSESIRWVNNTVLKYEPYKSNLQRTNMFFPRELKAPDDIRDWICAHATDEDELRVILTRQHDKLGNRNLRQAIQDEQFPIVRKFLIESFQFLICGPGSV